MPAGQSRVGVALVQRQRGVGLYPRNRRYLFSSCFRLVFVLFSSCFRLVFVLFSSCFRLFAVFISRWSEYGLGEDRARRAFEGRWKRIRAGGLRLCRVFGRTGGGCGKGENL